MLPPFMKNPSGYLGHSKGQSTGQQEWPAETPCPLRVSSLCCVRETPQFLNRPVVPVYAFTEGPRWPIIAALGRSTTKVSQRKFASLRKGRRRQLLQCAFEPLALFIEFLLQTVEDLRRRREI